MNGLELYLQSEDSARLGCAVPAEDAPTIGLLLGQEKGYLCIGRDYVQSLARTGVKILFLDYQHHLSQLQHCNGLLLPGGAFVSPDWYYTDAKSDICEHKMSGAGCMPSVFIMLWCMECLFWAFAPVCRLWPLSWAISSIARKTMWKHRCSTTLRIRWLTILIWWKTRLSVR